MPLSANRQSARMRQRAGMCETQLPVRVCGVALLNRMLSNQQLRGFIESNALKPAAPCRYQAALLGLDLACESL
jgi:hypothetical protein